MAQVQGTEFATRADMIVSQQARDATGWIITEDEGSTMLELHALASTKGGSVLHWSIASGWREFSYENGAIVWKDVAIAQPNPIAALSYIRNWLGETKDGKKNVDKTVFFVLADFDDFLDSPPVRRSLKEVSQQIKAAKSMLFVTSTVGIHPKLDKTFRIFNADLPSEEAHRKSAERRISTLASRTETSVNWDLSPDNMQRIARAGLGLTAAEFGTAVTRAVIKGKGVSGATYREIAREKKQIVQKSGLMEFIDTDATAADIGGLDNLKTWIGKRKRAFSPEARAFGLPEPKGVLMVGVQGCGKSLSAKAIGAIFNLPILRLDVGRLFGGLVGQSEDNTRKAIKVAEDLSPCILWIDEIDKGLGSKGGESDGGTSGRVMASLLTWMNEKTKPVFVVASANNADMLPPELLRKGRFDEIFAIDLPAEPERRTIFEIHLKKRGRKPEAFDLDGFAKLSVDFSGAEIETALCEALYDAFDADRELTNDDVIKAISETVPLAKTAPDKIEAIREWAKTRARPASSQQETTAAAAAATVHDDTPPVEPGPSDEYIDFNL